MRSMMVMLVFATTAAADFNSGCLGSSLSATASCGMFGVSAYSCVQSGGTSPTCYFGLHGSAMTCATSTAVAVETCTGHRVNSTAEVAKNVSAGSTCGSAGVNFVHCATTQGRAECVKAMGGALVCAYKAMPRTEPSVGAAEAKSSRGSRSCTSELSPTTPHNCRERCASDNPCPCLCPK